MKRHVQCFALLVGLMSTFACGHNACPTCRQIATERNRVKAGVILANYNTATDLLGALRTNGDSNLVNAAEILIAGASGFVGGFFESKACAAV